MSDQPIYLFEREVSSVNLKVFNAILHLLHKIGKEIMIECNIDGHVCFQALNDTKSVFATIEFRDIFWNSHHIVSNESFQCKMSSKTVCSVFRNLKKVNGFVFYQIEESGDCFIVFKFHTSDGITKTHLIPYQDCDIINAIFDEESSHVLQTQPTVFTELFDHLHQSPEIIIHADSNTFTLRSHSSSSLGMGSKNLSTDLNVDISEFDVYQYRGNTFVPDHNDDDDDETEPPSSELLFVSKEVILYTIITLYCTLYYVMGRQCNFILLYFIILVSSIVSFL